MYKVKILAGLKTNPIKQYTQAFLTCFGLPSFKYLFPSSLVMKCKPLTLMFFSAVSLFDIPGRNNNKGGEIKAAIIW